MTPLGVEFSEAGPGRLARLVLAAGLVVEALCYLAIGAGIAVLLQALHRAGMTP